MSAMNQLDLTNLTLCTGAHEPNEEQRMCVMEAVAYVAGEPWSDSPKCASPTIAAFLRSYNDCVNDEVRQTLKTYIQRLIGTAGTLAMEEKRGLMAADWLIRTHVPAWLRIAGLTSQANALAGLPEIVAFTQMPTVMAPLEAARSDAYAAWAAAGAAAWAAAGAAARDAAGAAAGDAARDAAWAAAGDAAWAAVRAAVRAKLASTVWGLQATVPALIERMLAVAG